MAKTKKGKKKAYNPASKDAQRLAKQAYKTTLEILENVRSQVLSWDDDADEATAVSRLLGVHQALSAETGQIESYLDHCGLVAPEFTSAVRHSAFTESYNAVCHHIHEASQKDAEDLEDEPKAKDILAPKKKDGEASIIRLPVLYRG